MFSFLEESGYLDITDFKHLFCLHYVFIPRINNHMLRFRECWDWHPLRSESNMTPVQLWVHGSQFYEPSQEAVVPSDINALGIDWDGPMPSPSHHYSGTTWQDTQVEVPQIPRILSDVNFETLRQTIDPERESQSYGIDIYCECLVTVEGLL